MTLRNWSENVEFTSAPIHAPQTVEELQELVRASSKVRAFGSRHSFNDIAAITAQVDAAQDQPPQLPTEQASWAYISLERLDAPVTFDPVRGAVTCPAGITYGELCPILHEQGVALHNMASLPHITVVGACATATHGSGDGNGNLATAVVGLEMVTADGELRTFSREQDGEAFEGAVVGLGGLGVVTRITLATEPAFLMAQELYEDLPVGELYAHFDQIMSSAYSVSLFTDWQEERVNQVWLKRRLAAPAGDGPPTEAQPRQRDLYGATPAPEHRHPVTRFAPDPCTPQMNIAGPWHERLPHFRVDGTPASGDELQTEYFVPRAHAVPALQAMEGLKERFASLLWISEVRSVAADRLWMSQSYGTPTIGIHFSWRKDWPAIRKLLPIVEKALAPFEVRPHWGKIFALSPAQVQTSFPRTADFRELVRSFDPQGKFRNSYLDRYLFGA